MAASYLWAWNDGLADWVKVLADADGKLIISDADPFTVEQTTPENLKHIPHGYYAVGDEYLPLAVDADGVLQTSGAVTGNLDDLADVNVPTPADQDLFYYDDATGLWKSRALIDADIPAAIARDTEVATAVSDHAAIKDAHFSNVITLTFIIDGGGSAITTGQKGHLEIPFACTLTAWTLAADVAGAIVIDVWKDTYANFPPTDADAMPGAGKEPTIAATNQKAQDTDISDWTSVAVAAGNILAFNVDSCTTITRVTLSLKATKT
jgi:hypothetical protein